MKSIRLHSGSFVPDLIRFPWYNQLDPVGLIQVIFSNLDLDTQIAKLESLGREASYEPRYHRTDPWTGWELN